MQIRPVPDYQIHHSDNCHRNVYAITMYNTTTTNHKHMNM